MTARPACPWYMPPTPHSSGRRYMVQILTQETGPWPECVIAEAYGATPQEAQERGRLIVAAPRMADALRGALEALESPDSMRRLVAISDIKAILSDLERN